jgi:hypothetical protein
MTNVNQIRNQIVDVVEKVGGPVTLARIARDVTGFEARGSYTWDYELGDMLVWTKMTKAGMRALNDVIFGKRVAVGPASALIYFLDGRYCTAANWMPILLLPKAMANFRTLGLLASGSEEVLQQFDALLAAHRAQGLPCAGVGRC